MAAGHEREAETESKAKTQDKAEADAKTDEEPALISLAAGRFTRRVGDAGQRVHVWTCRQEVEMKNIARVLSLLALVVVLSPAKVSAVDKPKNQLLPTLSSRPRT